MLGALMQVEMPVLRRLREAGPHGLSDSQRIEWILDRLEGRDVEPWMDLEDVDSALVSRRIPRDR